MDYILVKEGNLWMKCETSRIQKFRNHEFGYIAEIKKGDEIIERRLTEYEVRQIWESLSVRQRTQLVRRGYVSESPLMDFVRGWHGPVEDPEERRKRLLASLSVRMAQIQYRGE